MARIAGVDLPKNERIEIGLTRIFGIGRSLSKKILSETNINFDTRVKDLADEEIVKIRTVIETTG
jgi:small subunit ribosomal protein S13